MHYLIKDTLLEQVLHNIKPSLFTKSVLNLAAILISRNPTEQNQ